MKTQEMSMRVPPSGDGTGQSVSASGTSAATTNAVGGSTAVVYSNVECFAVWGSAPTATVAAGIPIPAGQPMRLHGWTSNTAKLAFITAGGTGTVYVRPDC